jgi:hypothetical protein
MKPTVEPTPAFVLDAALAELHATKATPETRDLGVATAIPSDAGGRTFRVQNPAVDLNGQRAAELYVCRKGQQRDVDELLSASHDEIVVTLKLDTPIHLFRRFDRTFVRNSN